MKRIALCLLAACLPALAAEPTPILDNSILIEEAYNQEPNVVQHINTFARYWNSKDWIYSFTQEWPGSRNPRNQLSYTITALHAGAFGGYGLGDTALNYRYQVYGSTETRAAFAPRLSALFPTGKAGQGRGAGDITIQTQLPLSVKVLPRLFTHWNAGASLVPRARNDAGDRARLFGYNLAQSFVVIAHSRVNFSLETTMTRFQQVAGPHQTVWSESLYTAPCVRWAYNFKNGLQIVPGVGFAIGLGPSRGEKALLLYLSFEHPWRGVPGI